jgi:outer membrane protein OmpA-like peptidoglycan-associated protein
MKIIYNIVLFVAFSTMQSQQKLDIYFDFDDSQLNELAIKKINSWIAEGKNYQVTKLYGFCDWKGSNTYNDSLAMKRVESVYTFLTASAILVDKKTEIRGFGEDFEQSKNQSENRRVTIIYEEQKKVIPNEVIHEKTDGELLKEKVKTAKKGDIIQLKNINFYNNSAKVVPKSEPILYDLLCIMNDNPNLKIEIQGHICCKLPTDPDVISSARARAVFNYLIRNKVNRTRMTFKGYGVTRPIHPIPEKNVIEEDDNRRVEILILEN